MKIEADWLSAPPLRAVFAALEQAGFAAYLVGGAVRNALLGEPVHDLDIATAATPTQVIGAAKTAGIKAIPTGIEHGTVTLVTGGIPHEITTFRRDVATDGRRATVAFTNDIVEDARRRDFTMNALYASSDGTVIDPLGGLPDTLARRVRFIEDADRRIAEDYLRILRFFRFHAQYGGSCAIDPDGLAAVAANLDGLEGLARERVGAEMMRLLSVPDPAPASAAMAASGALARVLPGAEVRALAPLVHLEAQMAVPPDALRRLAALGGEDAAARLRLSKAETARLASIREAVGDMQSAGALGYRHGADAARDVLLLRAVLLERPLDPADVNAAQDGARAVFPIAAADLMPRYQGPALGAKLAALEARWIASKFGLDRETLLEEDG